MRFQTPDAERFLFFFLLILAFHDCCKWQLQEGQGQDQDQDQDRGYGLINNADCRSPIGTRTSGSGRSPILRDHPPPGLSASLRGGFES